MAVIYSNIPANTATAVDHVLTGCENQVLFRAAQWGTTQVQIDSYSASDPTQKLWSENVHGGNNFDWCPPCVSLGEVWRFSVLTPDPITTELFVEILEPGCCCGTSSGECWEIPVKLTQCP